MKDHAVAATSEGAYAAAGAVRWAAAAKALRIIGPGPVHA